MYIHFQYVQNENVQKLLIDNGFQLQCSFILRKYRCVWFIRMRMEIY